MFFKNVYTEFRGNPTHRLAQGCKYPECQVAMATKLYIYWKLFHVALLAPRILRWHRDF